MNKFLLWTFGLLAALPALQAQNINLNPQKNPNAAKYKFVSFKKESGNWNNPSLWSSGKLPDNFSLVRPRGPTQWTVNSSVPMVRDLWVCAPKPNYSSLTIETNGVLQVENRLAIYGNNNDTEGRLELKGGTLRTGIGAFADDGWLWIGATPTYSSTGLATFSAGTFQGGIVIGAKLPQTGVGVLTIVGSKTKIASQNSHDRMVVNAFGKVVFVLDESGVSPIDATQSRVELRDGATIEVDGSKYTGGPKVIPLFKTRAAQIQKIKTQARGFGGTLSAQVRPSKSGVDLVIQKK